MLLSPRFNPLLLSSSLSKRDVKRGTCSLLSIRIRTTTNKDPNHNLNISFSKKIFRFFLLLLSQTQARSSLTLKRSAARRKSSQVKCSVEPRPRQQGQRPAMATQELVAALTQSQSHLKVTNDKKNKKTKTKNIPRLSLASGR